jgi:hypothetical protein
MFLYLFTLTFYICINLLKCFYIYSFNTSGSVVSNFFLKVRKCQKAIKSFNRINRARVILIHLYWEKIEKSYLAHCSQKAKLERLIARRIKKENLLAIMNSNRSDYNKKWLIINTKVHSLLNEVDRIYLENNLKEKVIIEQIKPISITQKVLFNDRYKYLTLKKERDQVIRKQLYIKRLIYIQNKTKFRNNTK